MDNFDKLVVGFHYNREFFNDGKVVRYYGGSEGMSYVYRDKILLPEIRGHLEDHCKGH